ncbi:MAG: hypothetical protein FWD57_06125, partial [Polyangiaceae bacterium]|nr:hypothetical protein [Polyangiaceae bacterium]
DEDDDDEDDEDDEDEDDEDEDDEDEDEKPKRSASVASRQPEKAQPAPPTNAASKFVPAAKQTGKQATKQAPKPVTPKPPTKAPAPAVVKHPSEIALPSRNSEILIGLTSTIAAYAAFFAGTLILDSSQEAKHSSYFSNSAWVFLIAYFCIAFAATQFIRRERPAPPKKIPTGDGPNSHLTKYFGNRKQPPLETTGLALGCLLCGPLYLAYISKAYEIWDRTYADKNPWMWIIFAVIFTLMTLGIAHALRPPSIEQEVNRRIPTRRIVLLLMTPFGLVYGMIYFASFLLPWK